MDELSILPEITLGIKGRETTEFLPQTDPYLPAYKPRPSPPRLFTSSYNVVFHHVHTLTYIDFSVGDTILPFHKAKNELRKMLIDAPQTC